MKSTIKLLSSLLGGKILNCKTMMKDFGYSNASREIIRKIELPFNIRLKREKVSSKNRYGEYVSYLNYSLEKRDIKKVANIIRSFNK